MKRLFKQTVFFVIAATLVIAAAPDNSSAGESPFIGEISYVGFNWAPRNWQSCNGQTLSINDNTALYSLLGTTYGGDGVTTFALPDMRGRVPIHQGRGPGISGNYMMGYRGGTEQITLSANTMPTHSHSATAESQSQSSVAPGATATSTLKAANTTMNQTNAAGHSLANQSGMIKAYSDTAPNVAMHAGSVVTTLDGIAVTTTTNTTVTVNNAGSSNPFPILQPYLVVNCIIATNGIYPTRP